MKEKFLSIPPSLQKQILLRLGGSGAGVAMLILVLAYGGDWRFLLPCIVLALLCLGLAASLYDRCAQEKYVIVEGTCTEIERAPFSRRIKAVYLRNDQHTVKLVGVRKLKNLIVGDMLNVYVADNTAVYEMDGSKIICSYLAIEKGTKVQRGNLTQPID